MRLDDCEIPDRLKAWHTLDLGSEGTGKKLLEALDARAHSKKGKQHVPANNLPILDKIPRLPNATTEPVVQEISVVPEKRTNDRNENIRLMNIVGIRILSAITGFLAPLMMRAMSDDYYRPGDSSTMSVIADYIANSHFAFLLLILISVVGAAWVVHKLDRRLEEAERPTWLRYSLFLPAGFLIGAFLDILGILMVMFVLPVVILLLVILLIFAGGLLLQLSGLFLGSLGGSSQSPSKEIHNPKDEPLQRRRSDPLEDEHPRSRVRPLGPCGG